MKNQTFFVSLVLGNGEENAISADDLCTILGVSNIRFLRKAVEFERAAGSPILSSNNGYFLPSTCDAQAVRELTAFVRKTDARLRSNRASVRPAQELLKKLESRDSGQHSLFSESGADNG